MRPRKPRPGGFGHHVRRYYGRCTGCIRWTGTGARRVTPPRAASQETCHKQPGLKSKSRGLETSVKAAVERREASAPEAGGPCKRMVRGARRARSANGWQHLFVWCGQFFSLRLPALRLPSFIWRRNSSGFRSCCKTRARMRRENASACFTSPRVRESVGVLWTPFFDLKNADPKDRLCEARGPLRESELIGNFVAVQRTLHGAQAAATPPHPNLLPARGEKERAGVAVTASGFPERRDRAHRDRKMLRHHAIGPAKNMQQEPCLKSSVKL